MNLRESKGVRIDDRVWRDERERVNKGIIISF